MTEPTSSGALSLCSLQKVQTGAVTLLDAVLTAPGQADLFFTHDTPLDAIVAGPGAEIVAQRTLGGSPMVSVRWSGPLDMLFDGRAVTIQPSPPERRRFAGRNVALALRNGEPARLVLDWLRYHHQTHGLNGAVMMRWEIPLLAMLATSYTCMPRWPSATNRYSARSCRQRAGPESWS